MEQTNTINDEPKVHYLKTWKQYFQAILQRSKRYELRKDDRGAVPGDYFMLQEYLPENKTYTGRQLLVAVTGKIVSAPKFGLKEGYAIFDIKFAEELDEEKQHEMRNVLNKML